MVAGFESDILRGKVAHRVSKKKGSTLRQKQYSSTYPLDTHFPQRRFVWGWEGGGLFACEQAKIYYLIIDERTQADFLLENDFVDARVLRQLVTVFEFDAEDERRDYLNNLILQSMGYDLVQETKDEKTYVAYGFNHRVTIPRATEITKEIARSIQRERRSKTL